MSVCTDTGLYTYVCTFASPPFSPFSSPFSTHPPKKCFHAPIKEMPPPTFAPHPRGKQGGRGLGLGWARGSAQILGVESLCTLSRFSFRKRGGLALK